MFFNAKEFLEQIAGVGTAVKETEDIEIYKPDIVVEAQPNISLGECPYCHKRQLVAGEYRSFNRKGNRKCLWCGLISMGK